DIFASKALAQLLVNGRPLTISDVEARLAAQGGLVSQRLAGLDAQLATLSVSQGEGFAEVLRVLDFWLPKIAMPHDQKTLNQTLNQALQAIQAIQEELKSLQAMSSAPPVPELVEGPDLAEANARLAEMPTSPHPPAPSPNTPRASGRWRGGVPPVRTLPGGSRMVFARLRHFVGRERELCCLARLLKGEQGAAAIGQVAAATGLGGIGKTQLAIEFAHR
ncbi:MAG: hypothetical protein ACPGWR_32790, partial [Ardenticatenaceae bacterium]